MSLLPLPLRRSFDFRGRSSREEFWPFQLAAIGILVTIAILAAQTDAPVGGPHGSGPDKR